MARRKKTALEVELDEAKLNHRLALTNLQLAKQHLGQASQLESANLGECSMALEAAQRNVERISSLTRNLWDDAAEGDAS